MLSSTSNSEPRYVEGPWLRTWLLTFVMVLAVLSGWEVTLRRMGYRPTVVDGKALWAQQRDRVYSHDGQRTLVLLGDCRMQLGLVPQVLRERFPGYRTVQLAVEQTSPMATLRDLAADEKFDGAVLCAVNARLLCRDLWDLQQPYVDYYHEEYRFNNSLNRWASTHVQRRLAAVHPELRLDKLLGHLIRQGRLPAPYYIEVRADRSRLGDFSNVDVEAHQLYALGQAQWMRSNRSLPAPPKWLEETGEIEEWVQAIQGRGGQVVFLRLPTTGALYSGDEFIFPKSRYWDAFAAQTSAVCVHFKDWPQLAAFDCPDLSHLDYTDAPRFTNELSHILADQGVLPAPPDTAWAWGVDAGQPQDLCCGPDHKRPDGSTCTCAEAEHATDPDLDMALAEAEALAAAEESSEDDDDDDWPDLVPVFQDQ